MRERDFPDFPPKGKRVKKKLRGGPWAKEEFNFTEVDGALHPSEIKVVRGDGSYVGRYLIRELQQKTRTIKVCEWETPEQAARAIRLGVLRGVLS